MISLEISQFPHEVKNDEIFTTLLLQKLPISIVFHLPGASILNKYNLMDLLTFARKKITGQKSIFHNIRQFCTLFRIIPQIFRAILNIIFFFWLNKRFV